MAGHRRQLASGIYRLGGCMDTVDDSQNKATGRSPDENMVGMYILQILRLTSLLASSIRAPGLGSGLLLSLVEWLAVSTLPSTG